MFPPRFLDDDRGIRQRVTLRLCVTAVAWRQRLVSIGVTLAIPPGALLQTTGNFLCEVSEVSREP